MDKFVIYMTHEKLIAINIMSLEKKIIYDGEIRQISISDKYVMMIGGNYTLHMYNIKYKNNDNWEITEVTNIPNKNIKYIKNCNTHSFALTHDDKLLGHGSNSYGELMMQTENYQLMTSTSAEFLDIKSIHCGNALTMILKNNGELLGCGHNGHFELGIGSDCHLNGIPRLLMKNNNIAQIECGYSHVLMLINNGEVYGWGNNNFRQLNHSTDKLIKSPILIKNDINIKQIACGQRHSIILYKNGTVIGFGANEYGELGNDDMCNVTEMVISIENVKYISCSNHNTLFYKYDGELWICGKNIYTTWKKIMTNFNIENLNGIKIMWKLSEYNKMPQNMKNNIFAFLLVCKEYQDKYKVKISKDMKYYIYSFIL